MQQFGSENLYVSSKRDITLPKQLGVGSSGTQALYFWRPLLLEKCQKAKIPCIPPFLCKELMISLFFLKWTEFTRNCEFFSFVGSQGLEINWNKFTISCKFDTLQVKWCYHMFSSIKMEEYMESELSGIFRVKLVAKNIMLGSSRTHFRHMRVKEIASHFPCCPVNCECL